MTEYIKNIIVECNRTRSKVNVNPIPESEDKYKNKWTNNISTTGIEVGVGDIISLEAGAINSKGANEQVIEFIGKNEQGFLDNKAELVLGFYVNHCGRNTASLPLFNHYNMPTGRQATDLANYSNMLQRAIGGFPEGIANPETNSSYLQVAPMQDILTDYSLTSEGNYYEAGKYYMAKPDGTPSPPGNVPYSTGDHIIVQVISVKSVGTDTGIIDEYKFINEGVNIGSFDNAGNAYNMFDGNPATYTLDIEVDRAGNILHNPRVTPSNPNPAVSQATLSIKARINPNLYMKNFTPPDNTRYYFLDPSYTGLDFVNWSATDTIKQLNEQVSLRKNNVMLEVPEGYNTPDNVAKLLTDILHEPTQVTKTTKLPFASFNTYRTNTHDYNNYGGRNTTLPSVVATPTYQPSPANGDPVANKQNEDFETSYETYRPDPGVTPLPPFVPPADLQEAMTRRSYYSCIAYAEPERYEGLQVFKNFQYFSDNTFPQNDINSGITPTQITSPFGNQEVGQLGQRVCSLNNLPTAGGQTGNAYCKFSRGKLILTNMRFNYVNLEALATGFRKCERYLNGDTKKAEFRSADYKQYTGVYLDIGNYDDKSSYKTDKNQRIVGSLNFFGSHRDFTDNSNIWLINNLQFSPQIEPPVITDKYPCFGQQRDGKPNDGNELEGLWVQSYWRDEFLVQNFNGVTKPPDGVDYYQLLNELGANYDGDFNLPNPSDPNSGQNFFKFNGGNDGTYADLIQMAKDLNIAAIPVFNTTPGNVFNDTHAYIAFVSAVNVDAPTELLGDSYDFRLGVPEQARWDFNLSIAEQTWFISKWNAQYGFQFGFDNSFTRNKAVLFTNLQETRELDPKQRENYAGVGMIGAVNPAFKFDPIAGRFTIEGLNSGMTIGNGNLQQPVLELEATDDPEQLCYNVGVIGNIQPYMNPSGYNGTTYTADKYFPCLDMRQLSSSIVASQSGVSILNIRIYYADNETLPKDQREDLAFDLRDVNAGTDIAGYYTDTLLDKMGFTLTQLLPNIGSSQSFFTNNLEFRGTAGSYSEAYQNSLPMTTGQYISSAEIQASSVNSIEMPQYDLGINFFRSARPDVEPASITAFRIPDKLNYPYLCIYSDIATAGADTSYYGGVDSHSKIPCLAFMTRNYNNGDYFYALESTFNYTCTKPFVLTDVTTDIRLPDGSRPQLDPNSAVIYKIQKSQQLPVAVAPAENKSNLILKEDERRKDFERRREAIRKTTK
jgi:hypothetical protein